MSVSVTLRQETDALDEGYRVISDIIAATPPGMAPLFVFQPGIDPWGEVYIRVADLDDLNAYVEIPLNFFKDTTPGKFATAVPGDVLIVDTAVPEWLSDLVTDQKFIVTEKLDDDTIILADKPFPLAKSGLEWTLKNAAETATKATGTGGYTTFEGQATQTDPFLRRHVTSIMSSVEKGSSRATAIKTGLESVVTAANTHGPDFEGVETVTYE